MPPKRRIGFESEKRTKERNAEMLSQVEPVDLIKYGLIPEFVGRLPVVATLEDLDVNSLVEILVKPRNALTKQYQRIFEYEDVTLKFTDGALEAIAEKAMDRKIGARGLRMILEDMMLDIMYQLPSLNDVEEIVINREVVDNKINPISLLQKAV